MAGVETLSPNTKYIGMVVGEKMKLTRPGGYRGVEYAASDVKIYRNGFKILYPKLGEFIDSSSDVGKTWVTYQHNKSGQQVIEFISTDLGSNKFHIVLQGVVVHDHASISMGGPAFATYYSEPTVTQEGA